MRFTLNLFNLEHQMERLQNPSEKGLGEDGKKKKYLGGDSTNCPCIAFKQTNQILLFFFFFFYCQFSPIANSLRLPISAMGDICCASVPRGELLCAAVFN